MLKPDPEITRLHRDWLTYLKRETGKSLTGLARGAKLSPSTLLRPFTDDAGTLRRGTIDRLLEHTGLPGPDQFQGDPADLEARRLDAPAPEMARYIDLLTAGRNDVEPWLVCSRVLDQAGIMPNDVVLCRLGAAYAVGDKVLALARHMNQIRPVLREFQRAGATDVLVSRSFDSNVPILAVDNDNVKIRGVLMPHRLAYIDAFAIVSRGT